jgi:hypothetical protein
MWSRFISRPGNMMMLIKFFESFNNVPNWIVNIKRKSINITCDVNLLVIGNTLTKPYNNISGQ